MTRRATTGTLRRKSGRESEERCVRRWRFGRLLAAGYARRDAAALAARRDVDLHQAVELLERSCPADTALAILL